MERGPAVLRRYVGSSEGVDPAGERADGEAKRAPRTGWSRCGGSGSSSAGRSKHTERRVLVRVVRPDWFPEWPTIRKADVSHLVRAAGDPGGAAVVLSSHRNGYVREAAIGEIAKRDDPLALPALILRSSDWVDEVRAAAGPAFLTVWRNRDVEDQTAAIPPVGTSRVCSIAIHHSSRHCVGRVLRRGRSGHDRADRSSRPQGQTGCCSQIVEAIVDGATRSRARPPGRHHHRACAGARVDRPP